MGNAIVIPVKHNGSIRISTNYKCTLNKALRDHAYLVPIVSYILSTLIGVKISGTLDLVIHRGAFPVKPQ